MICCLLLTPNTIEYRPIVAKKRSSASTSEIDKLLKTVKQMAGPRIAHATLKGPSVVKEICIGMVLGLAAGSVWKMHHWNEQRKTRAFYDLLEKDEISVVADEE
ncbi:hypothetical protein GLYMA_03G219600v4 [Glycine max]|uniref:Cytochrome c oxidase subunit 5C n=3 Tax=Glycine subgen. Soja TaxID=1462606 RepID=I1JQS3_SOYBN|nr:cytochrome c oxidase subunit 5C isoform X1 [Glycine max]XP_028226309.1 cytochrome c oxidase subunit 5C-like isoform X1 [Glycine soja]KAG5044126.1 hypothetical protein JHK87_008041 [Glycine soja]KAG5072984.1 hypothetical protein JHK86_008195 [Glycine max]KAH1071221.1 hypothetical protein GYH30_008005 [Glycine max]KAH1259088.1 Cytochrome c oxidase subunit 5C [Glycine max]KHN19213.1 Cytochrome c oxidase subunit 5C [Glycine soja]|eukprot:XP_003521595.1 cytochrome c oxidase subunit 5C isoform X1 [Glycine max]